MEKKLCCQNCFDDHFLKKYIEENGKQGICNYCGQKSKYCIEPNELEGIFEPVVSLYSLIEEFMPVEEMKEWDGSYIWDKLQEDWEIFSEDVKSRKHLLEAILNIRYDKDTGPTILDSFVEIQSEYWGDEPESNERWREFCKELIYNNRFFPDKKLNTTLIKDNLHLCKHTIYIGTHWYRGRISHGNKTFPLNEMGKPPIDKCKDGRANPRGIPYLYLASDVETAIAEVRPSVGYYVTIAKFETTSPIEVIDLRFPGIESPFEYGENIWDVLENVAFLRFLGHELSKPIKAEEELEYIPLQFLCELIKSSGYEGVIYKSGIAKGHNLALFEDTKVNNIKADLYKVGTVKYESNKI